MQREQCPIRRKLWLRLGANAFAPCVDQWGRAPHHNAAVYRAGTSLPLQWQLTAGTARARRAPRSGLRTHVHQDAGWSAKEVAQSYPER